MAKLKRLGVLSAAKLSGALMALAGLAAGAAYSLGGAVYELITGTLNTGTALAFLALLGMPATFAAAGFVAGGIVALMYNLVARRIGGLEVDLE